MVFDLVVILSNKAKQLPLVVGPAIMTSTPRKSLQRKNPSAASRRKSYDRRKSFYQPEEFADREFPLVFKPKMIKKVGDYCYFFHCTVKGNTGNRFNKNMAVLVHDGNVVVV